MDSEPLGWVPHPPLMTTMTHPSFSTPKQILMQVFYATIGASANVALVLKTAPILFLFSFVAIGSHLGLLILAGGRLGFSMRDILLASNANIGGKACLQTAYGNPLLLSDSQKPCSDSPAVIAL